MCTPHVAIENCAKQNATLVVRWTQKKKLMLSFNMNISLVLAINRHDFLGRNGHDFRDLVKYERKKDIRDSELISQ